MKASRRGRHCKKLSEKECGGRPCARRSSSVKDTAKRALKLRASWRDPPANQNYSQMALRVFGIVNRVGFKYCYGNCYSLSIWFMPWETCQLPTRCFCWASIRSTWIFGASITACIGQINVPRVRCRSLNVRAIQSQVRALKVKEWHSKTETWISKAE